MIQTALTVVLVSIVYYYTHEGIKYMDSRWAEVVFMMRRQSRDPNCKGVYRFSEEDKKAIVQIFKKVRYLSWIFVNSAFEIQCSRRASCQLDELLGKMDSRRYYFR